MHLILIIMIGSLDQLDEKSRCGARFIFCYHYTENY